MALAIRLITGFVGRLFARRLMNSDCFFLSIVFAGRAGRVPNDGGLRGFGVVLAVVFALDCRDGAKELIGDVGEDGGTARGDLVVRERQEKTREEIVDGLSGFELVEVGGEGGGQIE
jgi:hypothetical protein